MNIVAFLFVFAGVWFNIFQPVISVPASGSVFTGSMYDAFVVMANYISRNGLPGDGVAAGAILIFMVLCLIPLVAAVQGVCVLFRKGRHVSISLFLCALVYGLVAAGIYYVSHESFSSAFITDYIMPYAQKISFFTPAIWAACYLIASVFSLSVSPKPIRIPYDLDKPISLKKNEGVDLEKRLYFYVGLGWTLESDHCDLDVSAFILTDEKKVKENGDFLFYHNKAHKSGAVLLGPDNQEGGNGRDDNEHVDVDLSRVPDYARKIVFVVTIYDAENRGQNFGKVSNAFIRVVDMEQRKEIIRYDLPKHFSKDTAVKVGELEKNPAGNWSFRAIGKGVRGGLKAVCTEFGIDARDENFDVRSYR